ncbi:TIGR02677 family protein [Xanthomonas sp. NCPPB 1638]|uniref:TIGR02677 family protein n=1 Tax=Xanthomonas TaxID=338 RepID=UPI00132F2F5D|nr:TIGR02677 family protein [Xanthomonas cucurbitae]QHG88606.1 TIGR02677 family protein [Xanthomonas cucurbitae]WDM75187.1 TIGR02677 family protein [Xanthomonas cucurbitae]
MQTRDVSRTAAAADLFRHVTADKASVYRSIMAVFAGAKRQYRLQLRPDEVFAEALWEGEVPTQEDITAALAQLSTWGNLESQPDMARVSTLNDYYRARYIYRLSRGGEAVEVGLDAFERNLRHRAELQTVALEDIDSRLQALRQLLADVAATPQRLDSAKAHAILRDLVRVFEDLAANAQAFMAGVARSLELQQADATALVAYKRRLIEYLERFMGDLIRRSDTIARTLQHISLSIDNVLQQVAEREARDIAPGDPGELADEASRRRAIWQERWKGLCGWFLASGNEPPQAELLRARARAAIPQLLGAIAAVNERRSGRSDRSADFRVLAQWFAACNGDAQAHRLARAAFALQPARHFSLETSSDQDVTASTSWLDAPPLTINPRLREYGEAAPRGPLARVRDRSRERALMAQQLAEESQQVDAARRRLATGHPTRLSELGHLDAHAFGLFLSLLGEALADQANPDQAVERQTGDGLLQIRLEPLAVGSRAEIHTPAGIFSGRDHLLIIRSTQARA